jgi:PhoH-like ATPase
LKKNFVLDTNVLLHDPAALFKFDDNNVIVPIYVIEEIDQFKKDMSELGRNAREASRHLDEFREQGNLGVGVPLPSGGILRVAITNKRIADAFASPHTTDNLILASALDIQEREPDRSTVLVTKDTNLRVRADALGLTSENYHEGFTSAASLYPGACELLVPKKCIDVLYEEGRAAFDFEAQRERLLEAKQAETGGSGSTNGAKRNGNGFDFYPNEYVLLRDQTNENHTALGRINAEMDGFVALRGLKDGVWGVRPRNKEQHFALDCLMEDSIQLVTLAGKAGTGKTLLAIAAGLCKTLEEAIFHRVLVSRPIFPLGRDIGFLPGDVEEKLNPWMKPIFDNVEYLMGINQDDKRQGRGYHELMDMGVLQLEPLTYIRGRSIPHQFMIVDEAQNLTPHEVKTIITRVGEGTKLVLTGDPYQIDQPYVDSQSNGLTYVINKFRGQSIAATVTLQKGERSELAELAANLL